MDLTRLGADVRLLRRRRGWTQARLATEAKVPRSVILAVEGGRAGRVSADRLIAVTAALGAYLSLRLLFQGETLDRLRDRHHAAMVELLVNRLRMVGWDVATEVSFNEFGERGSIDILAFHPSTGALVVIEVKTVVPDVGGMLMTLDRKVRLAPRVAAQRGWNVGSVARLLVLPETATSRRRVTQHEATFANAFPDRNVVINRWLRAPLGTIAGLLFLSEVAALDSRRRFAD